MKERRKTQDDLSSLYLPFFLVFLYYYICNRERERERKKKEEKNNRKIYKKQTENRK